MVLDLSTADVRVGEALQVVNRGQLERAIGLAVGHLDHVAAIRRRLARHPRLYVTGIAFDGVGIPDCIHAAESTADALLDALINAAASAA